jgi:hypothetical protein
VDLERAGRALASDGSAKRVALGSWNHVDSGVSSGAVWVLSNPSAPSQSEFKITPANAFNNMGFAFSIAMNEPGDCLIVGCTPFQATPRVYVYRFDGATWNEEWIGTDPQTRDLGYSVAVSASGDVFAAGAPGTLQSGMVQSGAINVYRRSANGWFKEATVIPTDIFLNHAIGNSIAMSGDGRYLAGRTFGSANDPAPSGAVYIFEHNAGSWTQQAKLFEPVAYSNGGFGMALALDHVGQTLVAGNRLDSRFASQNGAVTIFRKLNGVWAVDAVALPSPPHVGGHFGVSVALNASGDRVFVGEIGAVQPGLGTVGKVSEFQRSAQGWQRGAEHTAPSPSLNSQFGTMVRTSASGSRWVASEPWADFNGTDSGVAHVFDSTCDDPVVYCTAQTNTLGCLPQIGAQGTPSASSTSGFRISVRNVRNQQNGMLLYGTNGRAAIPWLGGTLCVQPPLRRTPLVNSRGSAAPANDCSGVLLRDFNAWTFAAGDPALFPGQHVRAQFYSRDPGAVQNLNLSDAVEFYLEP